MNTSNLTLQKSFNENKLIDFTGSDNFIGAFKDIRFVGDTAVVAVIPFYNLLNGGRLQKLVRVDIPQDQILFTYSAYEDGDLTQF